MRVQVGRTGWLAGLVTSECVDELCCRLVPQLCIQVAVHHQLAWCSSSHKLCVHVVLECGTVRTYVHGPARLVCISCEFGLAMIPRLKCTCVAHPALLLPLCAAQVARPHARQQAAALLPVAHQPPRGGALRGPAGGQGTAAAADCSHAGEWVEHSGSSCCLAAWGSAGVVLRQAGLAAWLLVARGRHAVPINHRDQAPLHLCAGGMCCADSTAPHRVFMMPSCAAALTAAGISAARQHTSHPAD